MQLRNNVKVETPFGRGRVVFLVDCGNPVIKWVVTLTNTGEVRAFQPQEITLLNDAAEG